MSTWADSAGAARVFRAIRAARFRSVPPGKPSNWTCFLRLVDSAGEHEVPYSGGLPPALREVDSLMKALAAGAAPADSLPRDRQPLDRHAREP